MVYSKVYDHEGYQKEITDLRERLRIDAPDCILPKIKNDVPLETIFGHLGSIWVSPTYTPLALLLIKNL